MILKNKYFVGQKVYSPALNMTCPIVEIKRIDKVRDKELVYSLDWKDTYEYAEYYESDLYVSKEAYEKGQGEIRVGDEFYFLETSRKVIKSKARTVDEYIIENNRGLFGKSLCFKTKDQLLQAVKKAVEECE